MISLRPVTSRIASHVLGFTVDDAAERTIEVSPASCWSVEPPLTLPNEEDRIIAHHIDTVPAFNTDRLTSPVMRQEATRLRLVRDAIISNGTLLARKAFERLAPEQRKFIVAGEPEHIPEAALCSNYFTQKYFGHWLREGLTHELVAADYGLPPLVIDRAAWPHEPSYRDLLGFHPRRTRLARVDKLWVFDFFRYNEGFVERYNRIRNALRAQVEAPVKPGDRVYLARGTSGTGRWLANREEIQEALRSRGFIVIEPEELSARDLARTIAGARLVVAPEGSALAHAAIAMPRGAGLLTIMGAQHFNMNYKLISNALDFKFGFVIADAVNSDEFHQPVDRLLKAIDLVDNAVHRGPHGQVEIAPLR